jgi:8-oxo-dGTP diphosphatase
LHWWSYTTVVARAARDFDPVIGDAESLELRWVGLEDVQALPLHPGFATAWPGLRAELLRLLAE